MTQANVSTAYPEAQGVLASQPDTEDLRVALSAVTGDDYSDAELPELAAAARARIAELEPSAEADGYGSAASFEVAMLKELLSMMNGQPLNVTLH